MSSPGSPKAENTTYRIIKHHVAVFSEEGRTVRKEGCFCLRPISQNRRQRPGRPSPRPRGLYPLPQQATHPTVLLRIPT